MVRALGHHSPDRPVQVTPQGRSADRRGSGPRRLAATGTRDGDMAYAERGAGTPLLLIHGTLADHRWWAPQMEPLGRHYRVVAPSLRHYWPARWDGAGGGFTVA